MNKPIQDIMQSEYFGCGANNAQGLRIKSHWDGEIARCEWTPEHYHKGGPTWVHGGIIASIFDCHCAAAAMYAAGDADGRTAADPRRPWYVTARLNVTYLKPVPLGKTLLLEARVDKLDGRKAYVSCRLSVDGEECTTCTALFVRPRQDGE